MNEEELKQIRKTKWVNATISEIKAKKLKEPIVVNKALKINDLEKYLSITQKSLLHTKSERLERIFVYHLEQLLKL